jgi:hypothetical protein
VLVGELEAAPHRADRTDRLRLHLPDAPRGSASAPASRTSLRTALRLVRVRIRARYGCRRRRLASR